MEGTLTIKFLRVGCADGICIRFRGNDLQNHNIIVDGGVEKGNIYLETLRKEIEEIVNRGEFIDLWIISHIDDDHIGGILRFIKDKALIQNVDLSKTSFWYNYSNYDYYTGLRDKKFISVSQGIRLRDFLLKNTHLVQKITNTNSPVQYYGLKIDILSPDGARFERLIKKWEKEEIKIRKKVASKPKSSKENDYRIKIEDFDLSSFKEDSSEENGSSIAFLLQFEQKKILFLSDSHPSIIVNRLNKLGFSKTNKLKLDLMQVPHHGSKHNINNELLEMIECTNFVINADGYNIHNLPNKEAIVRIIKHSPQQPKIFITHKNNATTSIFNVDDNISEEVFLFPEPNTRALIFNF